MSIWDGTTEFREARADEIGSLVAPFCKGCKRVYSRADHPDRICWDCGGEIDWCDAEGRYAPPANPAKVPAVDGARYAPPQYDWAALGRQVTHGMSPADFARTMHRLGWSDGRASNDAEVAELRGKLALSEAREVPDGYYIVEATPGDYSAHRQGDHGQSAAVLARDVSRAEAIATCRAHAHAAEPEAREVPLSTESRASLDRGIADAKAGRVRPLDPALLAQPEPAAEAVAGRIEELIERSSFGTPEVKALRESVPREAVERVLRRADELRAAESEAPRALLLAADAVQERKLAVGVMSAGNDDDPTNTRGFWEHVAKQLQRVEDDLRGEAARARTEPEVREVLDGHHVTNGYLPSLQVETYEALVEDEDANAEDLQEALSVMLSGWRRRDTEVKRLQRELAEARERKPGFLAREMVKVRACIAALEQWTHEHGAALIPTAGSADTFGDGMRVAKRQVAGLLHNKQAPRPAPTGEPMVIDVSGMLEEHVEVIRARHQTMKPSDHAEDCPVRNGASADCVWPLAVCYRTP